MPAAPYDSFVPHVVAMLGNMKAWLDKAAAQGDETVMLNARLAPDMHPLPRQIQMASDGAKGAAARMIGDDAPAMPDTENSFAELKDRCDKTIAYLRSFDPASFNAGAQREIVLTFPNGAGIKFDTAERFLNGFALPNFYFHATATYAILRQQGAELGKADFLMHLAPFMFAPPAST
ncbi:DUF1993 family protein [Novosphingobium sp.]|uniref:DUF1993 domain-containing protein n=1 Tax=Novosphingobium sp. TaxID=1874826 RepID=UPI0025D9119A|nr:DUF1993 domain-containing protein [Novosphingobium sp.]